MAYSLLEGNEAIARGAVAAGCRFFAGYPITPATTIYHSMLNLLPPVGGICLQGEDEIASLLLARVSVCTVKTCPLRSAVKYRL